MSTTMETTSPEAPSTSSAPPPGTGTTDNGSSMTSNSSTTKDSSTTATSSRGVILFYKYHPLSSDKDTVRIYADALTKLCITLKFTGRILVGCNPHRSEGINGTLAGTTRNLEVFVQAMTSFENQPPNSNNGNHPVSDSTDPRSSSILHEFWSNCRVFYDKVSKEEHEGGGGEEDCPPLIMKESEFKWSVTSSNEEKPEGTLFPDLNIKITNELIGTGGVLAKIPLEEVGQGYLTPQEWHERIKKLKLSSSSAKKDTDCHNAGTDTETDETDTIVIDCRNTKECQIGHFPYAIDPQTTTFNQFTQWVKDHKHRLVGGGGDVVTTGSDSDGGNGQKHLNQQQEKAQPKKSILMYCTGGIRCEKASAFLRHELGQGIKEVRHLQGGIHKYLEAYPDPTQSLWQGQNFVFDNRGSHGLETNHNTQTTSVSTAFNKNDIVVGRCRYCTAPYETFDPHCICTVCREPVLVCNDCQRLDNTATKDTEDNTTSSSIREFHCRAHEHLQECYFTNIEQFSRSDLEIQLDKLQTLIKEIAVGKKFKQRRKTLTKQCLKLQSRIDELTTPGTTKQTNGKTAVCTDDDNENHNEITPRQLKCRNCGTAECDGKCWGFHSLKRKVVLDETQNHLSERGRDQDSMRDRADADTDKDRDHPSTTKKPKKNVNTSTANQNSVYKLRKEQQRRQEVEELKRLGLLTSPNIGRDAQSGIRLPSPCVRTLRVSTKGKWCGQTLSSVLLKEFAAEFKTVSRLGVLLKSGLIFVNDHSVRTLDEADELRLKNMDVISRVVYWQEPPVHIPFEKIEVQKIELPEKLFGGKDKTNGDLSSRFIYVCNKPSTVPVHPAGPYLSNSLTMMVEAQEDLEPKSLIPCHRIDRVTSGLTICCNDVQVARLVQGTIGQSSSSSSTENVVGKNSATVLKKYLARVHGYFPACSTSLEVTSSSSTALPSSTDIAKWNWVEDDEYMMLQVDAPIETVDPANGIRRITSDGKSATSLFTLREYDSATETSLVECYPKTGRSHQLRLHLQWLGYPIVNDIQYGGSSISTKDTTTTIDHLFEESLNRSKLTVDGAVGDDDPTMAAAARNVHPLHSCRNGMSSSLSERLSLTFTKPQLLQGGHAICLHALQYTLHLPMPKSSCNTSGSADNSNSNRETRTIELNVDLPPWAEDPKACV